MTDNCLLVPEKTAAEMCGISKTFLSRLRTKGDGPKHARLGSRIMYFPEDVREWLRQQVHKSSKA
jgi:predicted DNA-binding transcriptional regulator AlpA